MKNEQIWKAWLAAVLCLCLPLYAPAVLAEGAEAHFLLSDRNVGICKRLDGNTVISVVLGY